MNHKRELLTDIYNTLVQIRYPNITTATIENMEITILTGENRISLLSWLLARKCEKISAELQTLKGSDLEARLVQYYCKIGICNDKDILLGNCSPQEQHSTLNLILDYMKSMFVESSNDTDTKVEPIDDILQVLNDESSDRMLAIVKPKLNYVESLQYFDDIKKVLNEYTNSSSSTESDKEHSIEEIELPLKVNEDVTSENDRNAMFTSENTKFLDAFSVESLPVVKEKSIKSLYSMDSDIEDLYSNFSSLKQFLKAKDEICNTTVPDGIEKMTTPLNKIIVDILTSTGTIMNIRVDDL
ncbi:HAUS augmin-like complex subunit 7 [Megalopta genalis]|uniref:HAUS augmin-like complex subunit 7 n=1 Tax=Megalopta genalis TaxID=115081 RepID=UPI003FD0E70C